MCFSLLEEVAKHGVGKNCIPKGSSFPRGVIIITTPILLECTQHNGDAVVYIYKLCTLLLLLRCIIQ